MPYVGDSSGGVGVRPRSMDEAERRGWDLDGTGTGQANGMFDGDLAGIRSHLLELHL